MDITKPIVIIDLSSFIFYRFYAIQKWIGISKVELTSAQVLEKYAKLFEDQLKHIKKQLKVDWKNIILARDCPRDKIWRMSVYPEYKGTRDAQRVPDFYPAVFTIAYNDIIPRMQRDFGIHMIQYDRAEADDVIAVIHNEVRQRRCNTPIYILSSDTDFIQLATPCTNIINFQMKPLGASYNEDKQKHYLLWKVIRGDSSDNIPAIDKKVGDATAMKLAKDPAQLSAKLAASPNARANFERNNVLINFNHIPYDIVVGITTSMKKIVSVW